MSVIEQVATGDVAAVPAFLERCGLPQAGRTEALATAVVAHKAWGVIGCAALEMDVTVALVRLVAADQAQRLQAYGSQLVETMRGQARRLGVSEVFLLTQAASGYFPRFGLHPIARAVVSPAIQHSVEWQAACPSTAHVMVVKRNEVRQRQSQGTSSAYTT